MASTCYILLFASNLVLLLIRCPHGTVLQDMVGLDRVAAGVDVDVAAGWGRLRCVPRTNGSARKCSTGNWWCRMDCRHSASVTNEAAEPPQTSTQEKINILETTLAGQRRASTRWQNQKKLNGLKNTAKQIMGKAELDQHGDRAHRGRD